MRSLFALSLLVGLSTQTITHTSHAKNLRIPVGEFTQFRLAGEGREDDNLHADIMQTKYAINIEGKGGDDNFGTATDTKFDLFIFESEEDYNCYIEASTVWTEHGQQQLCDFLGARPDSVKEQIDKWNSADDYFLSKEHINNEVFVVMDNTGWLQQVSNGLPKDEYRDVTYELKIETAFAANDLYNRTFFFLVSLAACLFATMLLMCFVHRLQKKAHTQVLASKRELKRIYLQK